MFSNSFWMNLKCGTTYCTSNVPVFYVLNINLPPQKGGRTLCPTTHGSSFLDTRLELCLSTLTLFTSLKNYICNIDFIYSFPSFINRINSSYTMYNGISSCIEKLPLAPAGTDSTYLHIPK